MSKWEASGKSGDGNSKSGGGNNKFGGNRSSSQKSGRSQQSNGGGGAQQFQILTLIGILCQVITGNPLSRRERSQDSTLYK